MADKQQTLIYIEKENLEEAKFMSRNFINPEIKKRAYINALGAELVCGYLASEGIDVQNLHNIHSISKILENNDISDILLPNIHIDVRVVVDENQIFVPKSHFEKEMVPDVYVVLKLSEDFKTAEFLGYFTPSQIDKNNANTDYYFVNKNQLSSGERFIKFVNDFVGKSSRYLTEEDIYRGRELSVSMADHNITTVEEKELIELLLLSDSLRESVLEFDNFETLAYSAASEVVKTSQENDVVSASALGTVESALSEQESEIKGNGNFDVGDDLLDEPENEVVETLVNETELEINENISLAKDIEAIEDVAEEILLPDMETDKKIIEEISDVDEKELSVDDILDKTIASIDENEETKPIDDKKNNVAGNIVAALAGTVAAAGAVSVAAAAAETAKAEAIAEGVADAGTVGAAVSESAMKLASVSGDIIDNTYNDKISEQNKYIDSVDYDKAKIAPGAVEIPEGMQDVIDDLSKSKKRIDDEIEGEYDAPKDLSTLDKAESIASEVMEQNFKQETVDMESMETVEKEQYEDEDMEALSDIEQMTASADSISKSEEEFVEVHNIAENEVVDLPEITDFSIDEDGTLESHSTDLEYAQKDDSENLIDIKPLEGSITESLDFGDESVSLDEDILGAEDVISEDSLEEKKKEEQEDVDIEDFISEAEETAENLDIETEVTDLIGEESNSEDLKISETVVDDINQEFSEELLESDSAEKVLEEGIQTDIVEDVNIPDETNLSFEVPAEPEKADIIADDDISFDDFEKMFTEDESEEKPQEELSESLTEYNLNNVEQEINTAQDSEFSDLESSNYDDVIVESEPQAPAAFVASSNSTVISDKTFTVGEIPIDINNSGDENVAQNGPLTDLYDKKDHMAGESLLNNPGTMGAVKPQSKSPIGAIIGALIVLAIVGIVGFFAAKMFKAPTEEAPQPITDESLPVSSDNGVADSANTLNIDKNNIVNMDNNTNALASTSTTAKTQPTAANNAKKSGTATAFVDVKKLTWEVPDYVSYDANFKQYFQSVGKSLKLALTSDLLLATDYIYSSPVKVSVTFTKDGDFKNSQIINSSGSTQIDSIVLQTVNQTLKGVKAPHSVGNDESTTAILKIYF